jgi:hypothetical protein
MQSFSFQGKVFLGTRLTGGKPGALFWVGDAPKCDVALQTEAEDQKESYSGNRLTSARLQKGNSATVALTLNWASSQNLALGLYGTEIAVTSGTVTAETLPTVAAGDYVILEHGGISSLVITDSAGTPASLTAGTHYGLDSANGGTVKILDLASFVQPLKAAYAYTASADVTMFTAAPPERYLFLDGINTVDGSPVRVRLYKVRFDPSSSIPCINDGFGQLELSGSVLYDSEAAVDANLGGFGKIEQPTAV